MVGPMTGDGLGPCHLFTVDEVGRGERGPTMTTKDIFDLAGSDIIDMRDLAERLAELLAASADHDDHGQEADTDCPQCDEDARDELTALGDLASDLGTDLDGLSDYAENEPTMIHERYFVTYAEELADDIGAIDKDAAWPVTYIDWDAAADALKQDYSAVTFSGHEYWVRAY